MAGEGGIAFFPLIALPPCPVSPGISCSVYDGMQGWEGQFLLVPGINIKALKDLTGKEILTSLTQHTQTSLFWELCFGDHLTYRRVLYSMLCYSGLPPPSALPRWAFPLPTITFRSRHTPSHLFPLSPVLGVAVCERQGEEGSGVSHRTHSQFYTISWKACIGI